jgi:sialate O-acetylesterase
MFSDGAVLQRDKAVPVWGMAAPGEAVQVSFRGETAATQADKLGRWSVMLKPGTAGGPFELKVNATILRNVLVGEVWIASGQSNMVWQVSRSLNAEKEIASSADAELRFFKVANVVSPTPLDDVKGTWKEASPANTGDFCGAGYFFARHLREKLKVPVGVIQTSWGGTPAESWASALAMGSDPALISVFGDWARAMEAYPAGVLEKRQNLVGPMHQNLPGGLYNAMIAPLIPYAMRGVIWYQGENNGGRLSRALLYRKLFPALIQDWRRRWGQGDFPFLFVQLANYAKLTATTAWPELREAQTMTLGLANTGMAVTIDIGEAQDIHPKNKQDVGLRLALAARAVAYGEKLVYSGPLFRQAAREGAAMRVWFDHTGGGLVAKGGALTGFEVCQANNRCAAAEARIDGPTVVVSSGEIAEPASVRYAWANDPVCNLYNAEGLPAAPFRSNPD